MKKGLLITLPQSDDVTEYLSAFSQDIIKECEEKGINYKPVKKESVTRENTEELIKSYDYNFIVFNGHGNSDRICGHKNQIIIKVGENEQLLFNRIVYARSCWAAIELGPACTGKIGCFIGYDLPFMFISDTTYATNPSKDNTARIFFETSNKVPIGLVKGQTAEDANNNSKRAMQKAIKRFLAEPSKEFDAIAEALWNNYSGQVVVGNSAATM